MINVLGKCVESKIENVIIVHLDDEVYFEVMAEISDELYYEIGDDVENIISEPIEREAVIQIWERISRL